MIFIQGQAQDNRSRDPFVVNGVVTAGDDPLVVAAIGTTSRARLLGHTESHGRTTIARHDHHVAIEIQTNEVDTGGRPAPLVVLLAVEHLESSNIPRTLDTLRAHAALIGRTFDGDEVRGDLEEWSHSPKSAWRSADDAVPRVSRLARGSLQRVQASVKRARGLTDRMRKVELGE